MRFMTFQIALVAPCSSAVYASRICRSYTSALSVRTSFTISLRTMFHSSHCCRRFAFVAVCPPSCSHMASSSPLCGSCLVSLFCPQWISCLTNDSHHLTPSSCPCFLSSDHSAALCWILAHVPGVMQSLSGFFVSPASMFFASCLWPWLRRSLSSFAVIPSLCLLARKLSKVA